MTQEPNRRQIVADLTNDERRIGVIMSTDCDGAETRVSVKRWVRDDMMTPSECLTLGVYVGDGRWVEAEVHVRDAPRLVALIQHKAGLCSVPTRGTDAPEGTADNGQEQP